MSSSTLIETLIYQIGQVFLAGPDAQATVRRQAGTGLGQIGQGEGAQAGTAYRMKDGSIVCVPV